MYHMPYRQRRGYEATCAASETICRNYPVSVEVNGRMYPSIYCQFHACWQVQNGRACPLQKLPRASVCGRRELLLILDRDQIANKWADIHCQAIDNGTRCALEVKQGDTSVYRYCPQLRKTALSLFDFKANDYRSL